MVKAPPSFYIFSMFLTLFIVGLSINLVLFYTEEAFFMGIMGIVIGVISFISSVQTYEMVKFSENKDSNID